MATTFAYVVFHQNKRKDGSIPVKIRMIHNRRAKYFPTSVFVTKDQLDRKGTKVKDVRIAESLDALLKKYRGSASTITQAPYIDADEMAALVKADMKREKVFRLDFFQYAESKIVEMKPKTAEVYRTSMNALRRFVKSDTLDISEINHGFILAFKKFLENEPAVTIGKQTYKPKSAGCRAISLYLSNVRAIYNKALDEFNDDDYSPIRRLPFKKKTIPPQPVTEHRVLSREQMKQIIDFTSDNALDMMAKDVFLLSFFLAGMNTVDLYGLKNGDLKDGLITYNRAKTKDRRDDNALMVIRVEPEATPILNRYRSNTGDMLLMFSKKYTTSHGFNGAVNKHLKNILPGLNTYYSRHTWATMARNDCNVPRDVVSDGLVHASDDKVTEIYLKKDFSKIWDANRKVIDFVMGNG